MEKIMLRFPSLHLASFLKGPQIAFHPFIEGKVSIPKYLLEGLIFRMNFRTSQASVRAMRDQIEKHQEAHRELKIQNYIKLFFINLKRKDIHA
jgi:hypothetical protein